MREKSAYPVIAAADDDENARFLLERAFTKSAPDVQLLQFEDGAGLIRYLEKKAPYNDTVRFPRPDLMLIDLNMPRSSGFDVLAARRLNDEVNSIPALVLTSSDDRRDMQRARDLGATAYLVKPGSFNSLATIAQSLGTYFTLSEKARTVEGLLKQIESFVVADAVLEAAPAGASETDSPKLSSKNLKPSDFAGSALSGKGPKDSGAPAGDAPTEIPDMYRLLVEQVKDYAIFMLDRDGTIRSWNEGARRIKGYEASEIIGKNFSVFYPLVDLENHKPQYELRMAEEMGRYEEEGWRVRKDGSRFWANVVVTPLRDKKGKLYGFAKVTRDLTQKKLQEDNFQRVLESEERFRLLVEQVRDYAIFMLDAKGHIASWNQGARRLKGYSADEVMGKHFSIFYTREALEKDHPAYELKVAIAEGRYEEEGWRVKKDGSRFWASVVITSLWDKRGNLTGFAKVTRDLTERKITEDRLRAQKEELEAFAHTLTHDLRAPVRSVTNMANLMKEELPTLSEKEKVQYLDRIIRAGQSMNDLIRDVLQFSQLSLAEMPPETIPLGKVLDEVISNHESMIQGTGAKITVKPPLPTLHANKTILVQILANLISNALKFPKPSEPPRIEIFAVHHGATCEIHVRDHGIGIPEEYQKKIFEVFNRGAATSSVSGTGIGLAIVKRAAERLGGTVSLKSEENKGADFFITVPCEVFDDNQVTS